MAKIVLPDHPLILDRKQTRHQLWIADRTAAEIAFDGRADPARHDSWRDHLAQRAAFDTEEAIQLSLGVGNRPGFRPEVGEKRRSFLDCALMNEQDSRISRGLLRRTAEIADCFPREKSAIMPQEDQQRRSRAKLVAQACRARGLARRPVDRVPPQYHASLSSHAWGKERCRFSHNADSTRYDETSLRFSKQSPWDAQQEEHAEYLRRCGSWSKVEVIDGLTRGESSNPKS